MGSGLTARGVSVLGLCFSFAAAWAVTGSVVAPLLLLLSGFALAAEAAWVAVVAAAPAKRFSASALNSPPPVTPMEEARVRLRVSKSTRSLLRLSPTQEFLSYLPAELAGAGGVFEVEAVFRSPYSGEYVEKNLVAEAHGPLGLVSHTLKLPVTLVFKVYPETRAAAEVAAGLLNSPRLGEGVSVPSAGRGLEVYEVREYTGGDDLRSVNWKASAKRGELMVTRREAERSGAALLVLEAAASTHFARDRLAAAFLSAANTLYAAGERFAVLVHDGSSVLAYADASKPKASLLTALESSLEFAQVAPPPGVPAPLTSRAARVMRDELSSSGWTTLAHLLELGYLSRLQRSHSDRVFKEIREKIVDGGAGLGAGAGVSSVYWFTGFEAEGASERLAELSDYLRSKGVAESTVVAVDPTEPWVLAETEEEKSRLLGEYARRARSLRAYGVELRTNTRLPGNPDSLDPHTPRVRGTRNT